MAHLLLIEDYAFSAGEAESYTWYVAVASCGIEGVATGVIEIDVLPEQM